MFHVPITIFFFIDFTGLLTGMESGSSVADFPTGTGFGCLALELLGSSEVVPGGVSAPLDAGRMLAWTTLHPGASKLPLGSVQVVFSLLVPQFLLMLPDFDPDSVSDSASSSWSSD